MIVEAVKEEKMYMKFSNNMDADQRGSYLDVEGIKGYKRILALPEGADELPCTIWKGNVVVVRRVEEE
ncbi:hypothetical protein Tco_0693795 [Tanacetum coccineum]